MDANKEKVLDSIHYEIVPCCGLCIFAKMSPDGWGICVMHQYEHEKHSDRYREVSISQYGYCESFVRSPQSVEKLGKYKKYF